jgi:hypothetical protein
MPTPLGPLSTQVQEALRAKENEVLGAMITHANTTILSYATQGKVNVSVPLRGGVTNWVREQLIKAFRTAGWDQVYFKTYPADGPHPVTECMELQVGGVQK